MYRIIAVIFSLFILIGNVRSQSDMPQKNHILIIDKTGSMIGVNGSPNIWAKVKKTIVDYITNVEVGDKITIYTYHEFVDPVSIYDIDTKSEIDSAIAFVNALKADGKYTCSYKSLSEIFAQEGETSNEIRIFQVYTDGQDTGTDRCGGGTAQAAIKRFEMNNGDYDFLFYVTLGFKDKYMQEYIDNCEDCYSISTEKGDVMAPGIIIPKSLSMRYTKDRLSLNQGFIVNTSGELPVNFKVKVEPRIVLKGLSETQYNPEFSKTEFNPLVKESLELIFLNDPSSINEGVYSGYFKYISRPDPSVPIFVIPNVVKLEFVNKSVSTVKIKFTDVK